jgi:atlastin
MWSKPFIVTQSIGEDIAILLMDSQGVYDEDTDLRDWSTIFGITLLTSSIFIFNIFTDIQENNLTDLETFLVYGQMAIENDQSDEQIKPFQKLVLN